jgi:hypothetical protein
MKSIQYTIRAIPPKVDQSLRTRARETGKSLNDIAIEALTKGSGVATGTTFNDLDWFIGKNTLDSSFDEAIDWLDSAPKEIE